MVGRARLSLRYDGAEHSKDEGRLFYSRSREYVCQIVDVIATDLFIDVAYNRGYYRNVTLNVAKPRHGCLD